MDEKFIEKNKEVLLEEIAINLNEMNETIIQIMTSDISKNPAIDNSFLRNYIIGISQNLGYAIACFNQYNAFITGDLGKAPKPIGFGALIEKKEEN